MRTATGYVLALLAAAGTGATGGTNLRRPGASAVGFDARSFTLEGRRFLLRSGGLHYFRIPPAEWRDRLLQTRLAGFNAVHTPVPWSLHEPQEGRFRFEGDADLGRFLDLCAEMDLMAFVGIGPYVDATVSNGGLPAWLGDDPKLRVRASNPPFLRAVRNYWDKLLPIVATRQAPRGAVVLVQVEAHHPQPRSGYLSVLCEDAQRRGIRVPMVRSHLHPCTDFAKLETRDSTVFATTELVPAGPLQWGESWRPAEHFQGILFAGLARGIDAYNHALWAGGTNAQLLPASSFPTRFEARTSGLLEGGRRTEALAGAKEANLFAQAFEQVLAASTTLEDHPWLDQARRHGVSAEGRTDGQTALLFFRPAYGDGSLDLVWPEEVDREVLLPLDRHSHRHIVFRYPLTPHTTLAYSTAQVLAIRSFPRKRVLVVHTPQRTRAVMGFRADRRPKVVTGGDHLAWDAKTQLLTLQWRPDMRDSHADMVFQADETIHVVALATEDVPRAWVLGEAGILLGAPGVGPWSQEDGGLRIELRFLTRRQRTTLRFYPAGGQSAVEGLEGLSDAAYDREAGRVDCRLEVDVVPPIAALLRDWQMAELGGEVRPAFDDSAWAEAPRPRPMGQSPYGWYRCRFRCARRRRHRLTFENVADAATVFLNGQLVGQSPTKRLVDAPRAFPNPAAFDVTVREGENVLAVLVKNWGRYRNTATLDAPLAEATAWGILGRVALDTRTLGPWRQRQGMSPADRRLDWGPVRDIECPVRWYRTTFRLRAHPAHLAPRVRLDGLGHGAIWLNGRFAGLYQQHRYDGTHGFYLPPSWLREENELVVLEEGGKAPDNPEVKPDRYASELRLEVLYK
ncbi:MAG: beta-galactosidase [Candidatus Brocadiia bacterium]